MKNSIQRKRNSSSALTKSNMNADSVMKICPGVVNLIILLSSHHPLTDILHSVFRLAYTPQINTRSVCWSQMSNVFTSVPPLFGTAQDFLFKLAQLEAQLLLNLISNIAGGNNTGYGNPFIPPVGIQRSSFPSVPSGMFTLNRDSIPQMFSRPLSSLTEIHSLIANKKNNGLLAKETLSSITGNTTAPLPTSEEPLVRLNTNHLDKHFTLKPYVNYSQSQSVTAKATMPPDRPRTEEVEPKQPAMQRFPTANLTRALADLGLSLEDLELLSHFPDNQLTTEKLPLIIQHIQQCKGTKSLEHGYAKWNPSDQVGSSKKSSHCPGKHHHQRQSEWQESAIRSTNGKSSRSHFHRSLRGERYSPSELIHQTFTTKYAALKRITGRGSNAFLKKQQHRPAEVTKRRPGSVFSPSCSNINIRRSFASPVCNKTRYYTTKRCSSSSHRSTTSITTRNDCQQSSFPVKSGTTESLNIQMPQAKGVIRVTGIPLDYSERELIKMASPFGHPVYIIMATEIDTATCLDWKKALLILPTESSAQDMVKVYSAIPVHMKQQSLELVSQTVDLNSPVSVFHAFVKPVISNGLLTPLDHLLVVCNVPNQPCAATGVLRLLKPFGQVLQTLVLDRNKVDADQCRWNKNSVQMVLEMESASVALSVYEWSQKVPCLYHNHHLSFLRGCDVQSKC